MRINLGRLLILSILLLVAGAARAQKSQVVIVKSAKFKKPPVKTFLGKVSETAPVSVSDANSLISESLKIVDDKGVQYAISSYQFIYKKKSFIKNNETGKPEVVYTTDADRFKSTPLPEVWIKNIAGQIQKDEELYFFDIIVKDKLNRVFYAPDVKLVVK